MTVPKPRHERELAPPLWVPAEPREALAHVPHVGGPDLAGRSWLDALVELADREEALDG